ncbi:MAG: hypothetical protein ACRD3W_24940, partial [Terriglobales bacterium]
EDWTVDLPSLLLKLVVVAVAVDFLSVFVQGFSGFMQSKEPKHKLHTGMTRVAAWIGAIAAVPTAIVAALTIFYAVDRAAYGSFDLTIASTKDVWAIGTGLMALVGLALFACTYSWLLSSTGNEGKASKTFSQFAFSAKDGLSSQVKKFSRKNLPAAEPQIVPASRLSWSRKTNRFKLRVAQNPRTLVLIFAVLALAALLHLLVNGVVTILEPRAVVVGFNIPFLAYTISPGLLLFVFSLWAPAALLNGRALVAPAKAKAVKPDAGNTAKTDAENGAK